MSKVAAIHSALMTQLACDSHDSLTLASILGPPKAGEAGAYDENNIRSFLANVALRLRGDEPSYIFRWTTLDPKLCLSNKLWILAVEIGEATTVFNPETATPAVKPTEKE